MHQTINLQIIFTFSCLLFNFFTLLKYLYTIQIKYLILEQLIFKKINLIYYFFLLKHIINYILIF